MGLKSLCIYQKRSSNYQRLILRKKLLYGKPMLKRQWVIKAKFLLFTSNAADPQCCFKSKSLPLMFSSPISSEHFSIVLFPIFYFLGWAYLLKTCFFSTFYLNPLSSKYGFCSFVNGSIFVPAIINPKLRSHRKWDNH